MANKRVHGTTHEIPDERFEQERDKLAPVKAVAPFDVAIYEQRKVSRDCYVSYLTNRYSVPPTYVGKQVTLRVTPSEVFILFEKKVVAQHPVLQGRYKVITQHEHLEPLKQLRQPARKPMKRLIQARLKEVPEVEIRPLTTYEELAVGGGQ